jgi:rifampicin phosphotransferase
VFFFIVRQARRAVRNRENLRFARTKIFGVSRHLFRAMGRKLCLLGALDAPDDVFSLTVDEIVAYVEGRPTSLGLAAVARARKAEFDAYRRTPAPPDRFLTYGAVGASLAYPSILEETNLLRNAASDDPDLLRGVPCCPGVVEGTVRVVREMRDAEGLHGEILVTERTDPGWVPLYPSCSALLIERGSLLSHSAVVARELGLPTIVSISGGLMQRIKSGQRVRVDGARGEVVIMPQRESI